MCFPLFLLHIYFKFYIFFVNFYFDYFESLHFTYFKLIVFDFSASKYPFFSALVKRLQIYNL